MSFSRVDDGNFKRLIIYSFVAFLLTISTATTTLAWETEVKGKIFSPLAISQEFLYAATDKGVIYALDLQDGSIKWNKKLSSSRCGILSDHKSLYVLTEGKLYSLDTSNGNTKWSFESKKRALSQDFFYFPSITVSGSSLYFTLPQGLVYSLNKNNGALEWSFDTSSIEPSPVEVAGDLVFVGSGNGQLVALSEGGRKIWSFDTDSSGLTNPVATSDSVIVGSNNGYIYALNQVTGKLKWSYPGGDNVARFLKIEKDNLIAVTVNGSVLVLGIDGKLKWRYFSLAGYLSHPQVTESEFYVGGNDGNLRTFSLDGKMKWVYPTKGQFVGSPALTDKNLYLAVVDKKKSKSRIESSEREGFFDKRIQERGFLLKTFPLNWLFDYVIQESKTAFYQESGYLKLTSYPAAPLGVFTNTLQWQSPRGASFRRFLFSLGTVSFSAILLSGPFGLAIFVLASFLSFLGGWVKTNIFLAIASTKTTSNLKSLFKEALDNFVKKTQVVVVYFVELLALFFLFYIFSYFNLRSASFIVFSSLLAFVLLILGSSLTKVISFNFFDSGNLSEALRKSFTLERGRSVAIYVASYFTVFGLLTILLILLRAYSFMLLIPLAGLITFSFLFSLADLYILSETKGLKDSIKQSLAFILDKPLEIIAVLTLSSILLIALALVGYFLLGSWLGFVIELILISIALGYINCLTWTLGKSIHG